MALTDAELVIGNQAVSLIGQTIIDSDDTTTADTGTGGKIYEKIDLIFDQTRNALLRLFEWNFARVRIDLVGDWAADESYTTDQYVFVSSVLYKCNEAHTSTTWATDYVMDGTSYVMDGTDYVRDSNIDFKWDIVTDRPETYWDYRYALPSDFVRFVIRWLKHNETRFRIEGTNLLTNEEEININYIKKVTDTTEFDDLFTQVLIYDLAIKLTFSILGAGYPAQALRKELNIERQGWYFKARQICNAEVNQTGDFKWSDARFGSGVV